MQQANLKNISLQDFATAVASRKALPGGGCVAALAASLGAALAAMVARLTPEKARFADSAEEMGRLCDDAEGLLRELLDAVDRDAGSYRQVLAAYRLPKGDAGAIRKREEAIQAAFKGATEVPLQVADDALHVMGLAAQVAAKGDPALITDAGVGLLMARSAGLGALMNVRINLGFIEDQAYVERINARAGHLGRQILEKETDFLGRPEVRAFFPADTDWKWRPAF